MESTKKRSGYPIFASTAPQHAPFFSHKATKSIDPRLSRHRPIPWKQDEVKSIKKDGMELSNSDYSPTGPIGKHRSDVQLKSEYLIKTLLCNMCSHSDAQHSWNLATQRRPNVLTRQKKQLCNWMNILLNNIEVNSLFLVKIQIFYNSARQTWLWHLS